MIEQLYLNGQEVIQIYLNKNRILKKASEGESGACFFYVQMRGETING